MKVVINTCFGGFGLSHVACMRYAELAGFELYPYFDHITLNICGSNANIGNPGLMHHYSKVPINSLPRNKRDDPIVPDEQYWSYHSLSRCDPTLIQVIEEMGESANGRHSELRIVEIPDDVEWHIEDYNGSEHVAENHRTWS
jgi:hypothetical protein